MCTSSFSTTSARNSRLSKTRPLDNQCQLLLTTCKIHAKKFLFIPSYQFSFSSVLNFQRARPFLRISSVKTASGLAHETSFSNLTQKHVCGVFTPFLSLRSFYQVRAPLQYKRVWITTFSIFAERELIPGAQLRAHFFKISYAIIWSQFTNR